MSLELMIEEIWNGRERKRRDTRKSHLLARDRRTSSLHTTSANFPGIAWRKPADWSCFHRHPKHYRQQLQHARLRRSVRTHMRAYMRSRKTGSEADSFTPSPSLSYLDAFSLEYKINILRRRALCFLELLSLILFFDTWSCHFSMERSPKNM